MEGDLRTMAGPLWMLFIPPPIRPEDPVSPPPESILLDLYGYLSDRTNDTTVQGFTRDGKRIQVTFWAAHPPRVSCFTVHCPGLKSYPFGSMPKILGTEDDLVLLRVPISHESGNLRCSNNYFVYQAGTEREPPLLLLIPTSPPSFNDLEVALLRCRDHDTFFLAVLRKTFAEKQFELHIYNSKTGRWSTKSMYVDSPHNFDYVYAHKVITIGGELGSVGWVDLCRGILICDVLLDNHCLRYIPLPLPMVARQGHPIFVRDIVVLNGYIKFFRFTRGWEAATKKMDISNIGCGNKWEDDCAIKVLEVPVNSIVKAQMLPSLEEGDTEPNSMRLYPCYPALSLHDNGVVYLMNKPNHDEDKAWVIALDMRNKTFKGVFWHWETHRYQFGLPSKSDFQTSGHC